jgi:hypothetical protein
MGAGTIRVKVKTPAGEAEVEADPEHIKEAIELVPELASKLPSVDGGTRAAEPRGDGQVPEAAPKSQLPNVAVEKNDSLADIIGKFFVDPWGREKRKLSDVREALQAYGLNYPKQSVAVALLRLAKNTKIRRFKAEDGEYVYTASSVAGSTPQ